MVKPVLPNNFDQMDTAEKQSALANFRLEEANVYYTAVTGLENAAHLEVLRLRNLELRQYLVSQAVFPWDADFINLKAALIGLYQRWDEISSMPSNPCPLLFSLEEQEKTSSDAAEWRESAQILASMRGLMGIDDKGGTDPDNFSRAREMNHELRLAMLRKVESHEREICWQTWPFKDSDDKSPVPS